LSHTPENLPADKAAADRNWEAAVAVIEELGLQLHDDPSVRYRSDRHSSLLLPCSGAAAEPFLLKFFVVPEDGTFYPAGVRLDEYPRREAAFYRFLDTTDPDRKDIPAPKTVLIDIEDPPHWILLERVIGAVGPAEEILGQDHVFELLTKLRQISPESLIGRRHFPLNRWDPISYLERVRLMYEVLILAIGEQRWSRCQDFYKEALRWIESREQVVVHGDFTEENLLVNEEGQPFLLDFERIGIGNEDHDFAWFWIHSTRSPDWKHSLLQRYFGARIGSERVRMEWGLRAALVYLALRRLRFGHLVHGSEDDKAPSNIALLDAALAGGNELFVV
jgi:hypothetical protein